MRSIKFVVRIKSGGIITIPPVVIKRLRIQVGDDVDFNITDSGAIAVTKAPSKSEQRIARLRDRLSLALRRHRIAKI